MASQFNVERRVEDVVAGYVAARSKSQLLSISHAIRAIRTVMPNCETTNRELADMVAAAAINRSISISFDDIPGTEHTGRNLGETHAPG